MIVDLFQGGVHTPPTTVEAEKITIYLENGIGVDIYITKEEGALRIALDDMLIIPRATNVIYIVQK